MTPEEMHRRAEVEGLRNNLVLARAGEDNALKLAHKYYQHFLWMRALAVFAILVGVAIGFLIAPSFIACPHP